MPLDDFLGEAQAGARAGSEALFAVQPLEHLEHAIAEFRRDADAVVLHVIGVAAMLAAGTVIPEADLDALVRLIVVLDSVDDQISQQARDARDVAGDLWQRCGNLNFGIAFGQGIGKFGAQFLHDVIHVDRLYRQIRPGKSRELQQFADQLVREHA